MHVLLVSDVEVDEEDALVALYFGRRCEKPASNALLGTAPTRQ